MPIAESKAHVRAEVRAARSARSAEDRASAAEALARQCLALLPDRPVAVSAYLSLPTEPGTDPLLRSLHVAGHGILVPRIDGRALDWVPLHPETPLRRGPLGIREPEGDEVAPETLAALAVMFLPGLAVDATGVRLGQGGGYYDAVLAGVPRHDAGGPLRAIVLFDDEIRPEVPHEAHDAAVDCAVTPGGVTWFGAVTRRG